MRTSKIIKQLDWDSIFGNTSQTENLYDFLSDEISLTQFVNGFYPRSKNKKVIKLMKESNVANFVFHGKKIFNLANVGGFGGNGEWAVYKYIEKLK